MVRSPVKSEMDNGIKKGPWTPEEDKKLKDYIEKHGHGSWQSLPRRAGLNRCGKSCRLRWTNYLRPDIKRGNFSQQEVETIIDLHSTLGNKWAMIATHLPGRTDNEIKNYWNTHLRKKLLRAGIDPKTHQLITHFSLHPNFSNFPMESLANIRLLQNLLQLLNSNPLPSPSSLSPMIGTDLLNLFHANGMMNPSLFQLPSPLPNTVSGLSGDYEPISNIFRPPGIHQQGGNSFMNKECFLPGLTPAASEISSGDIGSSSVYDYSPPVQNFDETFASEKFERWGAAADDLADASFWKDVFNQSFPSSSSL